MPRLRHWSRLILVIGVDEDFLTKPTEEIGQYE
jgi:hypothetical protein